MMPIFLAMSFIAATVCCTAAPPSLACRADWIAMPSVTLAFSPFCVIEAVICSTDALVSSTLAACSLAPWFIACAVALTCSEADDSVSALDLTSPTTCDSLSAMLPSALTRRANSLEPVACARTVRSPAPTFSATESAWASGTVMLRAMAMAPNSATRHGDPDAARST